MWDDHQSPPDNANPLLDKQIQDQQAEIEDKRQQLTAERLAIIKSRSQSWEPGSIYGRGITPEQQAINKQRREEAFNKTLDSGIWGKWEKAAHQIQENNK